MSLHDKTVVTPFAWLGKRYCVLTQFLSASQQTSTRAYCIPALANLRGTMCMRSYRPHSIGSCTCPMSLSFCLLVAEAPLTCAGKNPA